MPKGVYRRNFGFFGSLTQSQRSVLLGTVLGDGHIECSRNMRNPLLRWSHGEKQRDYLIWKARQFGSLFGKIEPSRYQRRSGNWEVQLTSRCHPVLREFHELFYSRPAAECTVSVHKKRITSEILDQVDDLALAVWWADDGTINRNERGPDHHGRDSLALCAGGLTEPEYLLIQGWLEGFGVETRLWHEVGQNSVKIHLDADDSELLVRRMGKFIPDCMKSKLGTLAGVS